MKQTFRLIVYVEVEAKLGKLTEQGMHRIADAMMRQITPVEDQVKHEVLKIDVVDCLEEPK